jgi:Acetyltransferase (GNAT) family
MFQIRLATPDDLPVILDLIDAAAEWLRTRDTDQWSVPWPTEQERDARVLRGLLAGRTWLVEDYGIPVATVTCRPDGNPDLWTPRELLEQAGYMSRLVLNRKYAGTAAGAALTDWAAVRARREYHAESLRIDVWTTNTRLHGYYQDRGFIFLRFCADENYPSAALFYKRTSDVPAAAESQFWTIPFLPGAVAPRELAGQVRPGLRQLEHAVRGRYEPARVGHVKIRERLGASRGHARAGRLRSRRIHQNSSPARHDYSTSRHSYNTYGGSRTTRFGSRVAVPGSTSISLIRAAMAVYSRLIGIGYLFRGGIDL